MSVMGLYQADMVFPAVQDFPLIIPKFGILIKYYEIQDAYSEDILVRVFLPGDNNEAPSVALPFNRAAMVAATPPRRFELEEDQERIFNLTYPILFSPLVVKQEGFIKVRAVCGERITKLGSLMIRKMQADENIGIPIFPPPPPTAPPPVSG